MFRGVRSLVFLLGFVLVLVFSMGASSAPFSNVTLSSHPNMIQFEAQGVQIESMSLDVYGLDGSLRYHSGQQRGKKLDWRMRDNSGRKLAYGTYLYRIELISGPQNATTQKIGKVVIGPMGAQISSQPIQSTPSPGMKTEAPQIRAQALVGDIGPSGNSVLEGFSGNSILPAVQYGTISGGGTSGSINIVSDDGGTVSGGRNNQAGNGFGATSDAPDAVVGGGFNNTASSSYAVVAGGNNNTSSGPGAAIGGGTGNGSSGIASVVPGGSLNFASGNYSFAAGRRAKVSHNGSFAWADSGNSDFISLRENEFAVRASGGVRLELGSSALRVSNLINCSSIMSDENGSLACGPGGQSNFNRFQRLIIEECQAPFEAIRAIRADGTVDCTNVMHLLPNTVGALSLNKQLAERDAEIHSLRAELNAVKRSNHELEEKLVKLIERIEALENE